MKCLVGVAELASFLKLPKKTVYNYAASRKIPVIRVGKHLRFEPDAVLEHLKKLSQDCQPTPHLVTKGKPDFDELQRLVSPQRSLKSIGKPPAPSKE